MRRILILFAAVILAISGCAEKVDIEAERAKVQSVFDQFVQSNETVDIELLSKIFAHDADMVNFGLTSAAHYIGWEAYKEYMIEACESVDDVHISIRNQVIKVHASGKVAWISLIFDENLVAQGEQFSVEGARFTAVLEKRNDNWVFVQFHSSVPIASQVVEN